MFGLLLVAGLLYWFLKQHSANKNRDEWRRSALEEHRRLRDLAGEDQAGVIAELSVLMRRVALAVEPRKRIASLTDDQWLLKLNAIGDTSDYTSGVGALLYRHQYQRNSRLDDESIDGLFSLTAETIKNASPELLQQQKDDSVAAL